MAKQSKPMTKTELVDKLAGTAGTGKGDAKAVLDALRDHIHKTLKKSSGEVKLQDIGKFTVVRRKARMGRNPATGEAIKIKARKAIKFTAAKGLKDAVK